MTDNILNIEQLREMANITIDIPDFSGEGTIKVQVKKPRLLAMATQGQIPNHLMSIATEMTVGKTSKSKDGPQIKDVFSMMELYCQACLVSPTYDEFKEIMTDDQMGYIFNWAIGKIGNLNSFREDQGNGTSNNNVKEVSKKTK